MKRIFCVMLVVAMVFLCGVNVLAGAQGIITGAAVPNATMYELYLHYEGVFTLMATSSTIDFDLTSLDLEPGEHQFAVRATAPGFVPSSYSNLVTYTVSAGEAFAVYSATDNSLTFYKNSDTVTVGSTYKGKTVTAVYKDIETTNYTASDEVPWIVDQNNEKVTSVVVENEISPVSVAYWFYYFEFCESFDVSKLDTSNVTNMSNTFRNAASSVTTSVSINLDSWNVSNVVDMSRMFQNLGNESSDVEIYISGWDVSKVQTMASMFRNIAINSQTFFITDISNWDVSNVTDMSYMFYRTARDASYELNLMGWNVDNVTNYIKFNDEVESKIIAPAFE